MTRLVIKRKRGQQFFVDGDTIKVRIVDIEGGQVKLAIEAPSELTIHREEIYNRIKAEKIDEIFNCMQEELDDVDEELISEVMRKFGRCANDDSINEFKTN